MSTPLATDPGAALAVPRTRLSTQIAWGLLLVTLIWAWEGADIRPMALWRDSANMATFAKDFFPPDPESRNNCESLECWFGWFGPSLPFATHKPPHEPKPDLPRKILGNESGFPLPPP